MKRESQQTPVRDTSPHYLNLMEDRQATEKKPVNELYAHEAELEDLEELYRQSFQDYEVQLSTKRSSRDITDFDVVSPDFDDIEDLSMIDLNSNDQNAEERMPSMIMRKRADVEWIKGKHGLARAEGIKIGLNVDLNITYLRNKDRLEAILNEIPGHYSHIIAHMLQRLTRKFLEVTTDMAWKIRRRWLAVIFRSLAIDVFNVPISFQDTAALFNVELTGLMKLHSGLEETNLVVYNFVLQKKYNELLLEKIKYDIYYHHILPFRKQSTKYRIDEQELYEIRHNVDNYLQCNLKLIVTRANKKITYDQLVTWLSFDILNFYNPMYNPSFKPDLGTSYRDIVEHVQLPTITKYSLLYVAILYQLKLRKNRIMEKQESLRSTYRKRKTENTVNKRQAQTCEMRVKNIGLNSWDSFPLVVMIMLSLPLIDPSTITGWLWCKVPCNDFG